MNTDDLLEELKRSSEQLYAMNAIAKTLTSTLEPREVLETVMRHVSDLIRPLRWSLLLEDEHTGDLNFEIAVGEGVESLQGSRIKKNAGLAGAAFESGEIQVGQSATMDIPLDFEADAVAPPSVMALPLKSRGGTLGVIELVMGPDSKLTREDLQALHAIVDYAAIGLDNARNFRRVQELTTVDEHTGLFNARHLRTVLGNEIARATRFLHPLSLIFIDLDHFKDVNDTHGHQAGSAILGEVGELLLSCVRKIDSAYRYGGDEFAALLIESSGSGARIAGKRIRERIADHHFLVRRGLDIRLTASIGIATFPDDAGTGSDLLEAADKAMYRAKALGRNEVVASADLPVVPPPSGSLA